MERALCGDKPMPFIPIDLPGADVALFEDFLNTTTAAHFQAILEQTLPWRQRQVIIAGIGYDEPRLTSWHGKAYSYSGNSLEPAEMTGHLEHLKTLVQTALGDAGIRVAPFNSALANLYRAGFRDSIGMHADDERELGFEPAIASLSFGRAATLKFGPKKGRPGARLSLTLAPGSLLIMRGQTQRNYKHGIAKSPRPDDRNRLNITFRTIYA